MNGRRTATIKDVALEAGVSIATVSRARTHPELLSAETLARVNAAVERLGFRPNVIARDLRRAETRLILVIVPSLSPYFLDIFRGVEAAAGQSGFGVLVGHTDRDAARELAFVNQVSSGRADGVILATTADAVAIRQSRARIPPVVVAMDGCPDDILPSVCVDHGKAAEAATDHLIALGHRRIAHIAGARASGMARQRQDGYCRAMTRAGLGEEALCEPGDFTAESGEAAMTRLLARDPAPTAVFAANDEMAVGALRSLKAAGLQAPRDVSIVGFDDQRIAALAEPPLTTLSVPTYDIGYSAMLMLSDILRGRPTGGRRVLDVHLVLRGSTAPPPKP